MVSNFKNKLKDDFVLGVFMKTSDPAFVEIAGYGGLDYVILDLEHGPLDNRFIENMVRAAEIADIIPIVRVKKLDEVEILKALDLGAKGIQVPHIKDKASAVELVDSCKYSPVGKRGVCGYTRAAGYSHSEKFKYFKEANDNIVIAQLEGKEALENIEDILSTDGIDIFFVGPYDLSQSLGLIGDVSNPKVENAIMDIIEKARQRGKYIGIFVDDAEAARKWIDRGVKYISYSVDVGIYYQAVKSIVNSI